MGTIKLRRRTFLRGLGGVGLALPVLETMLNDHGTAYADGGAIPKRYLVCFTGANIGASADPLITELVPDTVGAGYDVKAALAPFAAPGELAGHYPTRERYDIAKDVAVVSGLRIPWDTGGGVPAGGRPNHFHGHQLAPMFTGMRSLEDENVQLPTAPSSDQIVADAIAGDTIFRSLSYLVQASAYGASFYGLASRMSAREQDGEVVMIDPTVSPQLAYKSLFGNFVPPDPAEAAAHDFMLKARKSVIDLVRGDAERLVAKLGGADRKRIERHFDELRDLEKRINAIPPALGGSCAILPDPGEDPGVGGNVPSVDGMTGYAGTDLNVGYSGEEERARVFCDLMRMAFACDLTRVGTILFTVESSVLNMYPLTGQPCDLHAISHYGLSGLVGGTPYENFSETQHQSVVVAWHMKHFAYLVDQLRQTPEGAGTLLDECAAVFLFGAGHGYSEEGYELGSHSSENMAALVAGRAGGLNAGHHVVADGLHPANVLVTAMNAVGVPTETLGEVTGVIPGLTG